ncbi:deoxyguanosinetriphosphate triphosphohydrolase family protein [Pseudorhodoplanes sp.]|uniref:deoxyguanosinetriphosphate triphosphohydrolase family protein n=1 Tax=Pseudorhodoplanes sp. TaxID=1934341 RepID=UPI003D0C58CA
MIISAAERSDRRHNATLSDQRSAFQRDRDRILYSSALRRLAGITQIARAGEADVFHTRLAHTLKVAQVGRRVAEFVIDRQPEEISTLGVHPEVVEAACLAHDLGHPPFGHHGEKVLNELVIQDNPDGFEGNAQSFRTVTRLAARFESCMGLDLTRATLAACIKYPWPRDADHPTHSKKWGVYASEREDFDFARMKSQSIRKTAEAELMDWADDIAYSVHDLEDFHRCRLLPWREILSETGRDKLVSNVISKGSDLSRSELIVAHEQMRAFIEGVVGAELYDPYEGTREQRVTVRVVTSQFIGHFVQATRLRLPSNESEPCIDISPEVRAQIAILKQITRDYIIDIPALAAQQHGQARMLRELFEDLRDLDAKSYLPKRFSYLFEDQTSKVRAIADCLCSMTERETVGLHGRLRGYDAGSLLDPIVR